jgi:hypothetical protein
VRDIRDNHPEIGLKFVEGGGNPPTSVLLDSGATLPMWPSWSVGLFDTNKSIGRDGHINCFKSCGPEGWNNFLWYIDSVTMHADSAHHFWFNTFEHGSDAPFDNTDPSDDSSGIVGFVPWLYRHYGAGGNNTVWVAPSEQIWCYTVVCQTARLSASLIEPYAGTKVSYAWGERGRVIGNSIYQSMFKKQGFGHTATVYDLRGANVRSGTYRSAGIIVVKR